MKEQYDYIIIGSGFGGSVCALRLAEKGYKVLIIEMGKWFKEEDFPKSNWNLKKWLWLPALRWYGIMKISFFKGITIISGNGVGGGSLVYANTLPVPKREFFNSGSWKDLEDWKNDLSPYYKTSLKMLGVEKNPKLFEGDNALKKLSEDIGKEQYFNATDVGVFFGEPDKTVSDPYFNGEGPDRTGCNFCGGCMTGCRYNAKNSLDKNYLYLATKLGAKILAKKEVHDVIPLGDKKGKDGYEVFFKSTTGLEGKKGSFRTKAIIFSAGVLGTVKLLLKLKKTSLPDLSDRLGFDIRTNNESLISITNLDGSKELSGGIAIGSILHTDKDSHLEICRYSNGSGFWRLTHFPLTFGKNTVIRLLKIVKKVLTQPVAHFKLFFIRDWGKRTAVLLFMQSLESTLRFSINRKGRLKSSVNEGKNPTAFIPNAGDLAKRYEKIINGKATVFALEPLAGIPSTAHILGGAVMGKDTSEGVLDKDNRVFGYDNMLVCDGSMISANPGVNPALSITAISERAMSKIPDKVNLV